MVARFQLPLDRGRTIFALECRWRS